MATNITSTASEIVKGKYRCKACNTMIQFSFPVSASATSSRMGMASRDARDDMIASAKSVSREALFERRRFYHEEINIKKNFDLFTNSYRCPNCKHMAEWSNSDFMVRVAYFLFAYLILWVLASSITSVREIVFPIIGIFIMLAVILYSVIEISKLINSRKAMAEWNEEWFPIIENEYGKMPDLSRYNIPTTIYNSLEQYVINALKPAVYLLIPELACGIICVIKVIILL